MKKSALDAFIERYNSGDLVGCDVTYCGYIFQYTGNFWGYVWKTGETGRENPDTEHEYGWNSFEEFLDDTMTEVGATFREILAAVPVEEALFD